MTKEELLAYIKDKYDIEPAYLWARDMDSYAMRHKRNLKWFGVGMRISRRKLGIDDDTVIDIFDVKAEPDFIALAVGTPGLFPGYHMNKQHWLTICLDGSIDAETVMSLVDASYELT